MTEFCKYLLTLSGDELKTLFYMWLGLAICVRIALPWGESLVNMSFKK